MKLNRALDAIPAKVLSYATIGVVISLFAVMMWVIPQTHDEWMYNRVCPDIPCYMENAGDFINCVGRPVETLSDAWESIYNHYNNWNPRLANGLRIILELSPHWVRDLLCILAFAGFLWLMLKLTLRHWSLAPALTALIVLSIFLFPSWAEGMFTPTFLFNYVVSALFSLAALWLIANEYPRRPVQWLWIAPLMAITPLMHESYTIAFGGVFLTLALQARSRKTLICFCIFAVFGVLEVFSPINILRCCGMHLRIVASLKFFIYDCVPAWLFLILLLAAYIKKVKISAFLIHNLCYIAGTAALFLFCCFSIGHSLSRALWPANLLMIIIDFKLCLLLWPNLIHRSWTSLTIWFFALGLITIWLISLIRLEDKLMKEQDIILEIVKDSSNKIVYLDLTKDTDIPFYYLKAYSSPSTDSPLLLRIQNFASVYDNPLEKNYMPNVILPTTTKGISPENWPIIPGSANLRGQYPVYYIGKNLDIRNFMQCKVEFANPFVEATDWKPMFPTRKLPNVVESFFDHNKTSVVTIPSYCARHIKENGDTLWFAYLNALPEGMKGRRIIKIDKSESCTENH